MNDRMALQFSGGKDSLALLHLMKPWCGHVLIVLCGAIRGMSSRETVAQMQQVKREVWQLHEVPGLRRQVNRYRLTRWMYCHCVLLTLVER